MKMQSSWTTFEYSYYWSVYMNIPKLEELVFFLFFLQRAVVMEGMLSEPVHMLEQSTAGFCSRSTTN